MFSLLHLSLNVRQSGLAHLVDYDLSIPPFRKRPILLSKDIKRVQYDDDDYKLTSTQTESRRVNYRLTNKLMRGRGVVDQKILD